MIVSTGSDNASIMLIGDYGQKQDAVHGHALSGSQESTLNQFFREAGYNANRCYRTLYIKDVLEYDGKSKKLKFLAVKKAFEDSVTKGLNYDTILKDEILAIQPNIIVPLGDMALKFCAGYTPLSSYRGSVLPLNPFLQSQITNKTVRVIGTFSPRAVQENYTSRVYVQLDFNKIVKLKDRTDAIETPGQIWVCRTIDALRRFLERHKDFYRRDPRDQFITFDIETYLGYPTAIGFCFDGKEAFSIPLVEQKVDKANALLLFCEIAKILYSKVGKVGQNVKYDWNGCERFGLAVNNVIGDTALGFHLLYPELPKNLGFQTSIYTDLPYFKDESNKKEIEFNPKLYTKDSLYLYNAKDCLATWQIHRKQIDEMEESGCLRLYNQRIVPLIQIYKEIDQIGIRVDTAIKKQLLSKYKALLDITATQFMTRIEPLVKFDSLEEAKATLRSATKLGHIIYDVLKYPVRYNQTEAGKRTYNTSKNTLDDLMLLHGEDNKLEGNGKRILNYIITCRKLVKVIEYIQTPLHPDGTLKTSYNLGGTENARTSASKTVDQLMEFDAKGKLIWPMRKLGRSLQTLTKHGFDIDGELYDTVGDERLGSDLRSMYVPRRGKVFVEGDLSQAEARVVAVLAEDYELLRQFDQKPKIHARTAGMIFKIDPTTIGKDFPIVPGIGITYYDLGKRIRHAGHLGMREFMLAQMTHMDVKECKSMLIDFHALNPKIQGIFHHETYEFVRKHGFLKSPFGRTRQFFDRISPSIAKEIYANLPQSTVSDQIKFSFPAFRCRAPWADILYEGHDAAMAEMDIGMEQDFCGIFKEEVEKPIDFRNCSLSRDIDLTIPCELSVGRENWQNMEEVRL